MKTIPTVLAAFGSALAAFSLHSQTIYDLDMGSDGTGDFVEAQIGRFGDTGGSDSQVFSFDSGNNRYQLSDVFGREATYRLDSVIGGGSPNISGNTYVSMSFDYFGDVGSGNSADPNHAFVAIGLRQNPNKATAKADNTYPLYYLLLDQGEFLMVRKWGYDNSTGQTTLGSYTLQASEISSTDSYRMDFSAVDTGTNSFGTIVDLEASLYQNGTLLSTLSVTDTPTAVEGENAFGSGGFQAFE